MESYYHEHDYHNLIVKDWRREKINSEGKENSKKLGDNPIEESEWSVDH